MYSITDSTDEFIEDDLLAVDVELNTALSLTPLKYILFILTFIKN